MKRWFWLPWFIVFVAFASTHHVSATNFTSTTKEDLNFEINSLTIDEQVMTITGWAFIRNAQNYRSPADHQVWIELLSPQDQLIIQTQLLPLDLTYIPAKVGYTTCADSVFFSKTCNYIYDYVGFVATINLHQLQVGATYTANILVRACNAKGHRKTPLYYPILSPIMTMVGDYAFSAISSLNDTSIRIVDDPVYARKEPSKSSAIWASGTSCSTSYSNRLYFKYGSLYTTILNRYPIDNQTYYALGGKLDLCIDGRRRILEGTSFIPVWISSLFVEYSGSPLTINSVLINTGPTIQAHDQVIYHGEFIDLPRLATAMDPEEGDISQKITITNSTYHDAPGTYDVTYAVSDKHGFTATKTIKITVVEPDNHPPRIIAFNQSILQYTTFDPFADVSAHDNEEGSLTERIIVSGEVNSSVLGEHWLCYLVTDNKGLSDEKCITVTVYNYTSLFTRLRSISMDKPFHNEPIPVSWKYHTNLFNQIKINVNPLHSTQLNKKPR
jgi:hypothetical protein